MKTEQSIQELWVNLEKKKEKGGKMCISQVPEEETTEQKKVLGNRMA